MVKKNTSQSAQSVTPVSVPTPVVVPEPVKATKSKKQKGGESVAPAPVVATPVVTAPVVTAPVVAPVPQTAGSKKSKKAVQSAEATPAPVVAQPAPEVVPVQNAGAVKPRKVAAKPKTPRQAKAKTADAKSKTADVKSKTADAKPKRGGKKTVTATPVQPEAVTEGEEKGRYFKYLYNGTVSGRFSGSKPKQAANKALTSIVKSQTESGEDLTNKLLTFSIIECTRGSKKKEYKYQGIRRALDKPIEVTIKDKNIPIVYRFQNKTNKLKVQQSPVVSA
jgi:hypothetical protein